MEHQGFYETLFCSIQETKPIGFAAAVLPSIPMFNAAPDRSNSCGSLKTWAGLLGVLGLPCNHMRMPDLPALLTGEDLELFSDSDLRALLYNSLILDGAAAEKLCQRGFGPQIGVLAEAWSGPKVSHEQWEGMELGPAEQYFRLSPNGPKTRIHSVLSHTKSCVNNNFEEVGPAVTLFEGDSGVRIAVFAASLAMQNMTSFYGFFDEGRKRQLVALLGWMCGRPLDFYYPGDAEVYLKLRQFEDGRYLLALFNLGHDPLPTIPLESCHEIDGVEMITPDGEWEPISVIDGDLQTPLLPAGPKVFRITACVNSQTVR